MKTKYEINSNVFGIYDVDRDGKITIIYGKIKKIQVVDNKNLYFIKCKNRVIPLFESQLVNPNNNNGNIFIQIDEMIRGK